MQQKVKAVIFGAVGATLFLCLGWFLGRFTAANTSAALAAERRLEVALERLHLQLARFQGIAIGVRRFGHATIWSDTFHPSRDEMMKRLDAYQTMSDQCLNDEWFQFARLHIRSSALHMSDLLERKEKLSAEIRVRCLVVPPDAPSEHPTKEEEESIASIITRFNELESVYQRIWDAIGSVSEEDISPNKSPEATTLARTPAADAPVAPAVGRASS